MKSESDQITHVNTMSKVVLLVMNCEFPDDFIWFCDEILCNLG